MTPTVQGETLVYLQDEQELTVGTPAWFAWLETASTFSFVSDEGLFTARHERSSQHRGGRYWKAYRKQHGSSPLATWASLRHSRLSAYGSWL